MTLDPLAIAMLIALAALIPVLGKAIGRM